jgi:hypothetical protein
VLPAAPALPNGFQTRPHLLGPFGMPFDQIRRLAGIFGQVEQFVPPGAVSSINDFIGFAS